MYFIYRFIGFLQLIVIQKLQDLRYSKQSSCHAVHCHCRVSIFGSVLNIVHLTLVMCSSDSSLHVLWIWICKFRVTYLLTCMVYIGTWLHVSYLGPYARLVVGGCRGGPTGPKAVTGVVPFKRYTFVPLSYQYEPFRSGVTTRFWRAGALQSSALTLIKP